MTGAGAFRWLGLAGAALTIVGALGAPAAADHQCAQWKDINVAFVIDYSSSMAGPRADMARSFATQVFNDLDNDGILTRVGWVGFPQPVTTVQLDTTSNSAVLNALQSTPSNRSEGSPENVYRVIEDAANVMANQSSAAVNVLIVVVDLLDVGVWTDAASDAFNDAATALRANGDWNYVVYPEDNAGIFIDARDLAQLGASNFASSLSAVPNLLSRLRQEACVSTLPHGPTAAFEILRPAGASLVADNDLLLGTEGFELVFDASASGDSEDANTDLHYEWLLTRPDQTTLRYSGSGVAAMIPHFHFSDEWLLAGTEHSVTLQVTDTDGNMSDPISRNFTVTGSPPDIVLEGAVDVDVGDWQRIWVRYRGTATPNTDIDGGPASHVLRIDQAPGGGVPAQGTTSPPNGEIQRATTQGDIGQWIITATATDDEGETDTATASFVVRNKPLELTLSGTEQVDVGDPVFVESLLVDDPDNGVGGGGLTFDWEIIQAPVGASPGLQALLASSSSITFPTTDAEAGTYIFRLTVTDDEPEPWTETAEAEFTVLVNAPPVAEIAGGSPLGSLSLPAQLLSGAGSSDPDSDRPHERLDGLPPQSLSAGVTDYTWTLVDASSDLLDDYPPGNVEDVFGVSGRGVDLGSPDLEPGFYVFQLEVTDAEGSSDSKTFTVEVIDEGGPPLVEIWPPAARYTVDATNTLWTDLTFSGAGSLDLDNAISGDPLPGIDDYTWGIMVAPPGCGVLPTEPSGASADHFTLASGGSAIDLACQGYWQVGLTITDDDTAPKQATADAVAVIGNCDGVICIDYPTTGFPAVVDFVDGTDIPIFFHLDSALTLIGGAFVRLEISHEDDPTTPFKTIYDPNPLPSGLGSHLVFQWDGYGDNGQRPKPGRYDVRIGLTDGLFAGIGIPAAEPRSIYIATTEPQILESSTRYINHQEMAEGSAVVEIDYQVFGTVEMDELRWRVFDRSGTVLKEDQLSDFSLGTFVWDGQIGPSIAEPDVYEIELEALRGGESLGASGRHRVVVYSFEVENDAPDIDNTFLTPLVLVNNDDDNFTGTEDKDDIGAIPAEDDLVQVVAFFEPPEIAERLVVASAAGSSFFRIWESKDRTDLIATERSYDMNVTEFPNAVWIEGISPGLGEMVWRLEDPAGNVIQEVSLDLHVVNFDLDIDTDMDDDIDLDDEVGEQIVDYPSIVYVNNDDDTEGLFRFIGTDSENSVVDGPQDKADLTRLILRQSAYLPAGAEVFLIATPKDKIRIFDDTFTAVTGPRTEDGGPDTDEHVVPLDKLARGDLIYWIEGIEHITDIATGLLGSISIELIGPDETTILAEDGFDIATNIIQNPPASGDTAYRNYVQARKSLDGVLGVEATLSADEPVITWDKLPDSPAFTGYWVGISAEDPPREDRASDRWLQTGVQEIWRTDGSLLIRRYFEVVADYAGYRSGDDPLGYRIFEQPLNHWTHGTFRLEFDDTGLIPLASVAYNGKEWKSVLSIGHRRKEFRVYTVAAETNQSISRVPGTPAAPAQVRDMFFKDEFGWHPWSLEGPDIKVIWTDAKGETEVRPRFPLAAYQHSFGFGFEWKSFQEFDFWDKRPQ